MESAISQMGKGTVALLKAALVLATIGAINWGLIGFFNWNLVDAIFGGGSNEMTSAASRVVYALVGLAGLASLFLLPNLLSSQRHQGVQSTPHVR